MRLIDVGAGVSTGGSGDVLAWLVDSRRAVVESINVGGYSLVGASGVNWAMYCCVSFGTLTVNSKQLGCRVGPGAGRCPLLVAMTAGCLGSNVAVSAQFWFVMPASGASCIVRMEGCCLWGLSMSA